MANFTVSAEAPQDPVLYPPQTYFGQYDPASIVPGAMMAGYDNPTLCESVNYFLLGGPAPDLPQMFNIRSAP